MNIFDLIPNAESYKRAGNKDGGEYHGACPLCGGTKRFHVWPLQGENGTFWCRDCKIKGDAIQYLRDVEGKSYNDACKIIGKEVVRDDPYSTLKLTVQKSKEIEARICAAPDDTWQEHAEKLVSQAHVNLLANTDQRKWLACRGINQDTAVKYKIGWLDKDEYRIRSSWGLPDVLKEDGKPRKLWLPAGLVIPAYSNGILQRVRIRRTTGDPRYYIAPGSSTAPLILSGSKRAMVIVESELDALAIASVASDLITAISLGNSTARPDAIADKLLSEAALILVALDSDHAGASEYQNWKSWYQQSIRYPTPIGKDPGEAFAAGLNLRNWILSALPVSLQPNLQIEKPVLPIAITPKPFLQGMLDRKGRSYSITDSREIWRQKQQSKETCFSVKEIDMAKKAVEWAGDQEQNLADCIMECKQVFTGSFIKNVKDLRA